MLNLNEYNESLYKALDKKNRKKNMVENYGQFLMNAKKTSGVTNLPDKTWLTDEVRGAISEAYKVLNKKSMRVNGSNDPSAIYDACRGEISVLAKLIRKANAGGLDSSYITQLNNYRNELESRAEEARSAMSRENQSSKVARHSEEAGEALEHGEKWRKRKYLRIENGRYIHPEDLEKMGKQNTYLNNMAKKEKAAGDAQKAFQNNPTKENYGNWNIALKERKQTKDAMKLQADVKKAENEEKKAKQDAAAKARADQNARAYDNNKAASDAQKLAIQSTGPVAQKKIDEAKTANYLNNKKAAEAQAIANQNNSTIGKKKMASGLKSNYENNKAAAEAMAEREANKNKPDPVADAKAVYEYQNEKRKAVGGSRDVSMSAQDKAKKDSEYKKSVNDILSKLSLQMDRLYNSNHPKGSIDNKEYLSAYDEASRKIEDIYKNIYGSDLPVSAGQETQRLLDNWRNNQEAIMNDAKKKVKNMKKDYEVIAAGKLRHSSFSISDEEMEAFLAHKAN